jgi:hypothetical protein
MLICNPVQQSISISDISGVANIILAIMTFCLAYYVFVYQRKKDKLTDLKTAELNNKNIRLQWFKELMIQPKIGELEDYFISIRSLQSKINGNDLTEEEIIALINFIKEEQSKLRKSFIDSFLILIPKVYESMISILDKLTDELTDIISNDELKLRNPKTYEKEINSRINQAHLDIYKIIFNYSGEN